MPRWRVAYFAGVVVAALTAAAGASGSDYGDRYVSSACCTLYGTHSSMRTPTTDFGLELNSLGLMAVRATGSAGIQTGFAQTNGIGFSCCCPGRTHITNFWETDAGGYRCAWVDSWPISYGGNEDYSVFRSNTTSSTTTWKAEIDQITWVTQDLGMATASKIWAVGELTQAGTVAIVRGTLSACYGCGNLLWQRATAAGGTQWFTVQSALAENVDGSWHIGSPPSPFTIYHRADLQ